MRTTRYVFSVLLFSLIVISSASSQTALQFVPMTPCRLLDTRSGSPLMGGQAQTIPVQGATCNIPSSALAYSFNVTVVPHGALNFLTLWPTGQDQPMVSTLNSYDGRTKAVAAIIPAGTGGAINAYATETTDLILDINGYFVSSMDSTLAFYTLTPCRLYDTRGGNYLHAQQTVNFPIQNICNIPSTAQAYSFNFTAVPRTGSLNYLTAWPAGQTQPNTSTLNAPTGVVTANAAIVQGGTDGAISVFAYDDTDLIIDVNGYFAPQGAPGQLALYTVTPCRVLDTRPMFFQGQRTVQVVSGPCNLPYFAEAYVVNATVIPQTVLGFLTLWGQGDQPLASTVNSYDGAVTSNMAIVPANTSDGTFQAYASSNTQLLIDVFSYMGPPPLMINSTTLSEGILNQPYQAQLTGTGGSPPYTWTVTGGNLPPGLTLAGSGLLSGTPTGTGNFSFTLQLSDSTGAFVTGQVSIAVASAPLTITTTQLPTGTAGVGYSAALSATGGVPPYSWSITSGLPPELTLDGPSGVISGTPSASGTYNFTVQLVDSGMATVSAPLQIVIDPQVSNGALTGSYAFALNGFQNGSPFVMAGSFIANGAGTLGGVLDLNTGNGSPSNGTAFTGTYTLSGSGVGTMSLNAGALGALNFHFALSQQGQGQIIWDNADPSPRGSGILLMQTPQEFYTPEAGPRVIASLGADVALNRYANAGTFSVATGGSISGASEDVNDNGTLGSRTFTGELLLVSARSGRGLGFFTFTNAVLNDYAYYIIAQRELLIIGIDPLSANAPLTLGTILEQPAGGFTNASLQRPSIVETTGLAPNNGAPVADVVLGLANWDGNGNGAVSLDENRGGTIAQQQVSQGTYNVASNGRVVLSGFGANPPILYLSNPNQAFVLGQDNSVAFGNLEPQSATPPYNNLSIFGTYVGGTINPAQSPIVDSTGYLLADGSGNLTGMANTSGPSGTGTRAFAATYQVDATGRAVVTGAPAGFMYVVSATKVVLLPTGNNPALGVFMTGLTN